MHNLKIMQNKCKYFRQKRDIFDKNNNELQEIYNIINELYKKEFYNIFSNIIIISKNHFFDTISSNIKKSLMHIYDIDIYSNENFISLIKTNESKYEKKYNEYILEINQFLANYKGSIKKDYKSNYITNFQKHCLQTDYYARHKCNKSKNLGYFIPILSTENNSRSIFDKSVKKSKIIKYVICLTCKKIYLSNRFLNFCSFCDTNYLCHIFEINEEQNLLPVVWNNIHCEFILNEKVICSHCKNQIYIDIKNNLLKCLKCKIFKPPKYFERTCNLCNAKYKSNILIYNPLEEKEFNDIIKNALLNKKKAKPSKQHFCINGQKKSADYFHNKACEGKLYLLEYNKKTIILCEKCKKTYCYDNFIWTCPNCENIFQENKNDVHEKIINLHKESESLTRNYSTSIFRRYKNLLKEKKESKLQIDNLNEQLLEQKKNCKKNSDKDEIKNSSNEEKQKDNTKIKKIDFFNISIKERERVPISLIKSQIDLFNSRHIETENNIINKDKIIHEIKDNNIKSEDCNTISIFRRYQNKNIKPLYSKTNTNKQNEMSEEKKKNKFDANSYFNINKFDEKKGLINKNQDKKIGEINENKQTNPTQKKSDYFENKKEEKQKNKYFFGIKNKLVNNKIENSNKIKEESGIQKIRNIEIHSFQKNIVNSNITPKFQLKNYLLNNSNDKNKDIKRKEDKVDIKSNPQNLFNKNNKIIESKQNSEKKKEETKVTIISVSKRINHKIIPNSPTQSQSKRIFNFESIKPSFNSPNHNHHIINFVDNFTTNSNIKQKESDYKDSYRLNIGNNNQIKKERVKFSSSPKKIIKLNKPDDIIEPEDIDTNKDFPINDPYLQSHPDLYEEMQENLKEIIYKNKLPIFNPDLYKIEKKIGEGTHGSIFQVANLKNGKKYAIKKIITNDIILLKYIKKEFELVYEAIHPNILSIYGIYVKCFDSTTFSLSVLMDLGEADWEIEISQRYYESKYYTEKELFSILKQLASGLLYLQKEKKIAHRDIKPENVIIFKNFIYKLGDFGEAKETTNSDKLNTLRGTDTYMSPILYRGLQMGQEDVIHDIYKSDVFSLGYSILYAASLTHEIINEIRELDNMDDIRGILFKRMRPRYSEKFINIILKMINPEETKRLDFIELNKLLN